MDYLVALFPPTVMAVAFSYLIYTLIKSQGGKNKYKEDAVVDAAIAAREPVSPQSTSAAGAAARAATQDRES